MRASVYHTSSSCYEHYEFLNKNSLIYLQTMYVWNMNVAFLVSRRHKMCDVNKLWSWSMSCQHPPMHNPSQNHYDWVVDEPR